MNDEPTFDPDRSRAIRQLLIKTVVSAPATRRTRHVQVLVGVIVLAVLTAGGTTAIALGGSTLFNPVQPLSSITPEPVTPTPTPTVPPIVPTSVPSPAPAVATVPIAPYDVTSAPAGASWSIDLPGSSESCVQHAAYSISDGYALVQAGPKITSGDGPDPCDLANNGVSLTLVDTATGGQVWSRSWGWDGSASRDVGVDTIVLGTSGRIMVNTEQPGFGPAEVLDLASGSTLGTLTLNDGEGIRQVQAVAGDSGEVIATIETLDAQLHTIGPSRVARFDPRDALHPVWSTTVDGSALSAQVVTNGISYTSLTYSPTGWQTAPPPGHTPYVNGVLNLSTGEISLRPESLRYYFFTGYTIRPSNYDANGSPLTLTGLDDDGNQIWTRSIPTSSSVIQVTTPLVRPGSSDLVGNGQFLIASPGALTLVDGLTNDTIWTTGQNGCDLVGTSSRLYGALIADGSTLVVNSSAGTACRLDAATGDALASPTQGNWSNPGMVATYEHHGGTGASTSLQTGETVWSVPSDPRSWFFAGGHLVALEGNTLSSVG
jgi:hypothetical protein